MARLAFQVPLIGYNLSKVPESLPRTACPGQLAQDVLRAAERLKPGLPHGARLRLEVLLGRHREQAKSTIHSLDHGAFAFDKMQPEPGTRSLMTAETSTSLGAA